MGARIEHWVQYKIDDYGDFEAGPYCCSELADWHRQDIAGFGGVTDARCVEREGAVPEGDPCSHPSNCQGA
jgi:hypothetical protein